MSVRYRLLWLSLFAVAMAWMESSVVLYLRTLLGASSRPYPLPLKLVRVETIREAATLVMLFAVGRLAGSAPRHKWAFSLVAFGIWDIFYYLFLVPLTGWPRSLLDWDILFLIPVPWWGPVLAPLLVCLLLVIGGVLGAVFDRQESPLRLGRIATIGGAAGVVLVLYSFLANSILAPAKGAELVGQTPPVRFPWLFFWTGLILLATPVVAITRQGLSRPKARPDG